MVRIRLLIVVFILIWACEDGNPLRDSSTKINTGETYIDTLYATLDTFIVKGKVNTGSSTKLLIGSHKDFSARFLIKFSNLGSDSGDVISAWILFKTISDFGSPSGPITCDVYPVQIEWAENANELSSWSTYNENIDPSAIASFEIAPADSIFKFEIPTTLIDMWKDTSDAVENYGLLIDYNAANYIKEISSSEGESSPELILEKIFPNDSAAIDTISSGILDASLIEYEGNLFEQDNENFYISAGYAVHSFIKFNLESIPENADISSANLILSKNGENSVINENRTTEITVRNVISNYDSLSLGIYEIDSSFTYTSSHDLYLSEENNSILYMKENIQANNSSIVIRRILNNELEHEMFYLEFYREYTDISVYSIKGSHVSNGISRPKLIIKYFIDKKRI